MTGCTERTNEVLPLQLTCSSCMRLFFFNACMYLGTRFHAAHACMYSCGVLFGLVLSYLDACMYAGHPFASMQGVI
jgi:hypothetical protein